MQGNDKFTSLSAENLLKVTGDVYVRSNDGLNLLSLFRLESVGGGVSVRGLHPFTLLPATHRHAPFPGHDTLHSIRIPCCPAHMPHCPRAR